MKKLLGLFAVLFATVAHAAFYEVDKNGVKTYYTDAQKAWHAKYGHLLTGGLVANYCRDLIVSYECFIALPGASSGNGWFSVRKVNLDSCPSGYALVDGVCVQGAQENDCSANEGKVTFLSVFSGWASMNPDGTLKDFKGTGNVPNTVCYKGCSFALLDNTPVPNTSGTKKDATGEWLPVYSSYQYMGFNQTCESETDLEKPTTDAPQTEAEKEPETKEEKPLEEQKDGAGCTAAGGLWVKNAGGGGSCVPHSKCEGGMGVENGVAVCGNPKKDDGETSSEGDGNAEGNKDIEGGADSGAATGDSGGNAEGSSEGGGNSGNGGLNGSGTGQNGGGVESGEGGEEGTGDGVRLGEVSTLYQPKYKDGIAGVWSGKKGQLQASGLSTLAGRLMPSYDSGTCPTWNVDLNLGRKMNFGSFDVAPPCWVWSVLRGIVFVCSLLLARRLVFGG